MSGQARCAQVAAALAVMSCGTQAQQVPDRDWRAPITRPAYAVNQGPTICVDEAHRNFHTLGDKFFAFGTLLRQDGYRVEPSVAAFEAGAFEGCSLLVIANAAPEGGAMGDLPYPTPSAFTASEISAVEHWVKEGGALLLIADHMPFGGAAAGLAGAFTVKFTDGFALREPQSDAPDIFRRTDHSLANHAIARGRGGREAVSSVWTFTGQAFLAPGAQPLLVFPDGYVQWLPRKPWVFTPETPRIPIRGWLQGAALQSGRGRAAFFGEAAMFSAQLVGPDRERVGMNTPGAEQNFQFVLNVVHWLTRVR